MMQVLDVNSISNEECRKYYTPADETHLCTLNGKGEGICMVSVAILVKKILVKVLKYFLLIALVFVG